MVTSLLIQSFGYMHASHQHKPLERGRSRTPKTTPIAMAFGGPATHLNRRHLGANNIQVHSVVPPHQFRQTPVYQPSRRRPTPRKGKSPDRSEPGALEDAIHEAHARGDLRQCLQWVLELQGVYLDWDDPRLDTVTEDDLCFAESAGMGPDSTPEERARAEKYWAMRQAEEDEARRVWELTATEEEKKVSRRLRAQLEAEQRKRDARAEYFRAPRKDKVATHLRQRPSPEIRPVLSCSIESTDTTQTVTRRLSYSRQEFLFPFDEGEIFSVRTMWREQGRQGLAISEALVRPTVKAPVQSSDVSQPKVQSPCLEGSDTPDTTTAPSSVSASSTSSGSAPSALFSSVLTTTSVATSLSTVTQLSSPCSPSKVSSSDALQAATHAATQLTPKFVLVPSAESPLHQHAAVALREVLEAKHTCHNRHDLRRTQSVPRNSERDIPHRSRSVSSGNKWLRKGSKAVEGLVDLVARLPTSYLPTSDLMETPLRTASCPPASRIHSLTPSVAPETFIYLLPLKPPSCPRVFPPIPTLPRSPYRPLTPPPQLTPRIRLVSNPHFLRLKALQNRVLWGLVPVTQTECEALAHIERTHQTNAAGRADVDRFGQMFTAKETMMRVAVDGLGRSALPVEISPDPDETSSMAALWSWWSIRL